MNANLLSNNLLKNLFSLSQGNRLSITQEIPNYDNFIESQHDIGITHMDIVTKNITDDLFNHFIDNEQEEGKSLLVIKPTHNKIKEEIYVPNKNLLIDLGNDNNLILNFIEVEHPFYEKNIIYNFMISVFPSINNHNKEFRYKIIENFCNSLSYGLTREKLFQKFNYKSLVSKNKIQNSLIDSELRFSIPFEQISIILSDYYNINIIVIIENLLLYNPHHNNERLSTLFLYYNNKFIVIMNDKHFGLFPPKFVQDLESNILEKTNMKPITKLNPISKYKLPDIVQIANSLNIRITKTLGEKQKNKTKLEIYNEIITFFPE